MPESPQLLGIYPGMPMMAAKSQLQRHATAFQIRSAEDGGQFDLVVTYPSTPEETDVFLTRAPNDPTVWMIRRSQNFTVSEPMSISLLLSSLREKYGKETLTMDRGGGGLYFFWIFDASGKLRASADQVLTGCAGNNFINYLRDGPPPSPNALEEACFRSFFAVTAMLNRHDSEMLQSYAVELVNLPFALRAATNTLRAKNAAADQAGQDRVNKANQNKPSF